MEKKKRGGRFCTEKGIAGRRKERGLPEEKKKEYAPKPSKALYCRKPKKGEKKRSTKEGEPFLKGQPGKRRRTLEKTKKVYDIVDTRKKKNFSGKKGEKNKRAREEGGVIECEGKTLYQPLKGKKKLDPRVVRGEETGKGGKKRGLLKPEKKELAGFKN